MNQQPGMLGQDLVTPARVAASMRQVSAQYSAYGANCVPVAWVDSWAAQLDAASYAPQYPYRQPYYQYPYARYPLSYYSFHPIESFIPIVPFGRTANVSVTTTSTRGSGLFAR